MGLSRDCYSIMSVEYDIKNILYYLKFYKIGDYSEVIDNSVIDILIRDNDEFLKYIQNKIKNNNPLNNRNILNDFFSKLSKIPIFKDIKFSFILSIYTQSNYESFTDRELITIRNGEIIDNQKYRVDKSWEIKKEKVKERGFWEGIDLLESIKRDAENSELIKYIHEMNDRIKKLEKNNKEN